MRFGPRRSPTHSRRARRGGWELRRLAKTVRDMAALLSARDDELAELKRQRDHLEYEAHHRVGNNLQVIISLLNMQHRAMNDPRAQAGIAETRQRINALALINRAVFEGPELSQVDIKVFLQGLLAELELEDPVDHPKFRVELAVELLTIHRDALAPLALFTLEAIVNARKHGLAKTGGRLEIAMRNTEALAIVSIADSGAGKGQPAAMRGRGVGQTLMRALARQINGQVNFEANAQGGLTTSMTFPTSRIS